MPPFEECVTKVNLNKYPIKDAKRTNTIIRFFQLSHFLRNVIMFVTLFKTRKIFFKHILNIEKEKKLKNYHGQAIRAVFSQPLTGEKLF